METKCCQKGSLVQKNISQIKKDLDVLNDENRLRILCLLKGNKRLCVCEIYQALGLPQNLASYHLGKLREAGFLRSGKSGKKVLYELEKNKIDKLSKLIKIIF